MEKLTSRIFNSIVLMLILLVWYNSSSYLCIRVGNYLMKLECRYLIMSRCKIYYNLIIFKEFNNEISMI
jgi:hypothetical protein